MRARIAAAVVLALWTVGCRQVDTPAPSSAASSLNALPDQPNTAPEAPSARTVEVCRIPIEETDDVLPAPCYLGALESGWHPPPPGDESEAAPLNFGDASQGIAQLSIEPIASAEARPVANSDATVDHAPMDGFQSRCGRILTATRDDVLHDYANYYSLNTLGQFVVILAPAAVFANSDYDADVGTWYQTHVRSVDTDRASNLIRPLGNGYYTIPFYVSAKLLGEYFEDQPGMALLGQFGDRTTRALLVGAPPFLALQYLTGGGRPSIYADESYWRPFRGSHGASGHAFMGAVPFLTLAGMTDDPLAKCVFYACSPWAGFTRINDNVHYISQVWLGWWMAFLATESVYNTEKEKGPLAITPVVTPEMTGIGFTYQR